MTFIWTAKPKNTHVTCFILVVWTQTHGISEVCLYVLLLKTLLDWDYLL